MTADGEEVAVLDAFRRWGYLQADLDWLGRLAPAEHPELPAAGDGVAAARRFYCGTLAVEFMHLPDPARRAWIQERMEAPAPDVDRRTLLDQLMRATIFEQVLQTKYLGNKRFSLEGLEALIPVLSAMLETASGHDTPSAVLGMSHRGRLNVMAHIVSIDYADLLAGFEDVDPRSIMGAGDVKYHRGATGALCFPGGRVIAIHLASNPSHLEAVNPVMMGRTRAKQDRQGRDRNQVVPILMHGDAAFAGQGITAETLNLAGLDGFDVGGTLHVIVNNLIGFTAEPRALHSTRFASDLAKRLPIPVFHVNAEDPEAAVRGARLAADYRYAFASDVVLDLIGFRRHGHSEIDDPTLTQPRLYAAIQKRPPLWESYAARIEADGERVRALAAEIRQEVSAAKERAGGLTEIPLMRRLPAYWDGFVGGEYRPALEVPTGIDTAEIELVGDHLARLPRAFEVHPKARRLLDQRHEMARGERPIDFGMAEVLAYGSLVRAGVPVRISGQDSRRGTFSHRHLVLLDGRTGEEHYLLEGLAAPPAFFEIYDSALSEAAVLGFEYGYSRDYPEALVAWEAQFGDFANGAQVIFDQFVTAAEDKWGLLSGLVVLLPHGFEGQGPEHSSARIERFLQLAAEDAIQIAQPTTAAQHFHLLRRQALRKWRKPLIVFTPKSLLRHPAAASARAAFGRERFLPVMPERQLDSAERILLCTGKLAHELRAEREKRGAGATAIVALEQLYPFPRHELAAELDRFGEAREILWVQEEPANMGALFFVVPRLEPLTRGRHVRTVKRSPSASPATGSPKAHALEQQALLDLAFS
ncbi:MAG: 2-oxoglutarate dehydrogenase E1 component [Acidobacteriota bacterium]|nr:2-oxoglutarate dehydrogenase E1 component [Acidobacteriota bacterium]